MLCSECSCEDQDEEGAGFHGFLADADVRIRRLRYRSLLHHSLSRIKAGRTVSLRTEVRLRRRGNLPGVVGLTTYVIGGYAPSGVTKVEPKAHTITFYTELLDQLSDKAVMAVMAHELAHAWLNEHVRPEASAAREEDADMLAEMWGFGPELEALSAETEPVDR